MVSSGRAVDGRAGDLDDHRPGQGVCAAFDEAPDGHRVARSITTDAGARWRGDAYGTGERERR